MFQERAVGYVHRVYKPFVNPDHMQGNLTNTNIYFCFHGLTDCSSDWNIALNFPNHQSRIKNTLPNVREPKVFTDLLTDISSSSWQTLKQCIKVNLNTVEQWIFLFSMASSRSPVLVEEGWCCTFPRAQASPQQVGNSPRVAASLGIIWSAINFF